jgi:hypothetical protein
VLDSLWRVPRTRPARAVYDPFAALGYHRRESLLATIEGEIGPRDRPGSRRDRPLWARGSGS